MTTSPQSADSGYTSCMISRTHDNTQQEIIKTTVDKLKIVVMEYGQFLDTKYRWIEPLICSLTVLLAFSTTDFKDRFGFSKTAWEGIFVFILVASIAWFVFSIIKAAKAISVDDFVDKIKNLPSGSHAE